MENQVRKALPDLPQVVVVLAMAEIRIFFIGAFYVAKDNLTWSNKSDKLNMQLSKLTGDYVGG